MPLQSTPAAVWWYGGRKQKTPPHAGGPSIALPRSVRVSGTGGVRRGWRVAAAAATAAALHRD